MKFLAYLEKGKEYWIAIIIAFLFILLRLPSLIEPYWYGDEGIYQVIGQALHNGSLLYRDIWDNKPPLLYIIYAFANGDQLIVRLASLLAGTASMLFLFFLSQKLFHSLRVSMIVSLVYSIFLATPLAEGNIANAENFIVLPVLAAAYIIFVTLKKQNILMYFIAGILLGLAFLLKIVALFDLAAFVLFIFYSTYKNFTLPKLKKTLLPLIPLFIGFVTPVLITFLYFFFNGIFKEFIHASFFGNITYVGWKNTFLGIPQGLLLLKLFLLASVSVLLFIKRHSFSSTTLFVCLWISFSLFNAFFSGRPYTHYVLVMVPVYCIFLGMILTRKGYFSKIISFILMLIISYITFSFFHLYNFSKLLAYYPITYKFVIGQESFENYQKFFDRKVPRDYMVADFISTHTKDKDKVFIWGNNAQIYALSNKQPLTKYTVAYHVADKAAFQITENAINQQKPKYIIVLRENEPLPFRIPLYIMRFSLEGATIYERNI